MATDTFHQDALEVGDRPALSLWTENTPTWWAPTAVRGLAQLFGVRLNGGLLADRAITFQEWAGRTAGPHAKL